MNECNSIETVNKTKTDQTKFRLTEISNIEKNFNS